MYFSTRGTMDKKSAATAIKLGLAEDGGLFIPEKLPLINSDWLSTLVPMSYQQRAISVLKLFLDDYTEAELQDCVEKAYALQKFDHQAIAPTIRISEQDYVLELWHGPTSAFKDMALQLLPQLLSTALVKTQEKDTIVILVATSGDTGKAALEGFKDVAQTNMIVFFPEEGVSEMQKLQMLTQEGDNVQVVAVTGNFDDAQSGVKRIFNDKQFNELLRSQNFRLSSANSINWGRLAPQIVYYFSAYADMVKEGNIKLGQNVNFVVPTGNFGNILAGYYAKLMGLPVQKLICASNSNNVLTEFLQTGVYDRNRNFYKTISPSMDILISSNLERLLYYVVDGNTMLIRQWMEQLNNDGYYNIEASHLKAIKEVFWSDWVNDSETMAMIKNIYESYRYVADPHTAVAWKVSERYRQATGDTTPTIIVSTASPFKFNESVLTAITGETVLPGNEFHLLKCLSKETGWKVPIALAELERKAIIHSKVCKKEEMPLVVSNILS